MEIKDIIKLVDAGFTKDEITALTSAPAEAAPAETPEAPEEAVKEDIPAEPAPVRTEKMPANQPDQMAQLLKAMEEMSNRIISHNINQTVTDGAPGRTVEDMLAEVINPPRKEGKK